MNEIEPDYSLFDTETRDADGEAEVSVRLGGLEVEIVAGSIDEAEASFERVWNKVLADGEEMSAALRERMGGFE